MDGAWAYPISKFFFKQLPVYSNQTYVIFSSEIDGNLQFTPVLLHLKALPQLLYDTFDLDWKAPAYYVRLQWFGTSMLFKFFFRLLVSLPLLLFVNLPTTNPTCA